VTVPTSTDGWYPRSFVLTDIVDSVSLWERDAELMSKAVARHDAMISREVEAAGGTLVRSKGEGDSTFSVFAHPAEAVVAAVAIQGAVAAERWPTAVPLRVRAGVHTGDAEPRDGDWYGPAVWELVAADDPRLAVPRPAKVRDLSLARTGFVGRAVELGLLEELLGQARAGESVTVLICGEAGAGKTRRDRDGRRGPRWGDPHGSGELHVRRPHGVGVRSLRGGAPHGCSGARQR
jgi:hypothetical protein